MRTAIKILTIIMMIATPAYALKTASWVGGSYTSSGYSDPMIISGNFSLSIHFDGATGSVDLQRCRSDGAAATCDESIGNWRTIDTFTDDNESVGSSVGALIYYRLKFTVSSGTITGEIYQ